MTAKGRDYGSCHLRAWPAESLGLVEFQLGMPIVFHKYSPLFSALPESLPNVDSETGVPGMAKVPGLRSLCLDTSVLQLDWNLLNCLDLY